MEIKLELFKEYLKELPLDTLNEFLQTDSAYELQKHYDRAKLDIDLFSSFNESIVKQFTIDKYILRYGK